MTYKTILVYFSNEVHAQRVLQMAASLATKHEAHLIGLYVKPAIQFYPAVAIDIPVEIVESHRDHHSEIAERIGRSFEAATAREGVSAEWRSADSLQADRSSTVVEHARTADLLLMSQWDTEIDGPDDSSIQARIVMEVGRPVLLMPNSGDIKPFGGHIMVAWNGSAEASRATLAALPFLKSADQAYVHWVNPPADVAHDVAVTGAALATNLARHDVNVETSSSQTSSLSVGEELLSEANARGCDMIVMGAYGHSRMREFVFGGATRHIFGNMNLPIFMMH